MSEKTVSYKIMPAESEPQLSCGWNDPPWDRANVLCADHFHPAGSDHHPETKAKLLYDARRIHVRFNVRDRYVRCVHTEYQSPVFFDSCVEFFVQPRAGQGYFNFEVNCGGTLLLHYREHDGPPPVDHSKAVHVDERLARGIRIEASMPRVVDPEIMDPVEWRAAWSIPFTLFEEFVGPLTPVAGTAWRANFYKCGNELSHPHWASWAPVGGRLDFHQPQLFAPIEFAP
ncbi:MAG: carbohydrate-binding family 9-like protein [bacterium]|nr:carbohydrate-binding family 9-like protein [Candidatus Sumerlaeota bacterium]